MDIKEILSIVKKTATETANWSAKKSSEIVEMTKLKFEISKTEDQINADIREIGSLMYDNHKSGGEPIDFSEYFSKIDQEVLKIEELSIKLDEIRSLKICNACGEKVNSDATYCYKCGEKI